jgi:hypothetical protein
MSFILYILSLYQIVLVVLIELEVGDHLPRPFSPRSAGSINQTQECMRLF